MYISGDTHLLEARNEHPLAQLFLGVYAELLQRGAWTPTPRDPDLPAGVWINFNEFEGAARRNRLQMAPAIALLRALRPTAKGVGFPCVFESRSVPGRPRAKEHYVELHDVTNPWGAYPPTDLFRQRRRDAARASIIKLMRATSAKSGWDFDEPESYIAGELARWEDNEREDLRKSFGALPPTPPPGEAPSDLVIACRR